MAKVNKFRLFLVVLLLIQAPTIWISLSKLHDIYASSRKEHLKLLTDQALERHVASLGISMGEWRRNLEAECRKDRDSFLVEIESGRAKLSWIDSLADPRELANRDYDLCARGGSYLSVFPTVLDSTLFMLKNNYQPIIAGAIFVASAPALLAWLIVFGVPFVLARFLAWLTFSKSDPDAK